MNPHYINNSFEDTSLFSEMDPSEPLLGKLHDTLLKLDLSPFNYS
jgi:hypothetical protein